MEMSAHGAGVLETRCVELAKKYGVELYVGRTLERERKGTTVMSQEKILFEDMPITGISIKDNCTIVSFAPMDYAPEKVAAIFDIIAQNHINIDIINQKHPRGQNRLFLQRPDAQADELRAALANPPAPGLRDGHPQRLYADKRRRRRHGDPYGGGLPRVWRFGPRRHTLLSDNDVGNLHFLHHRPGQ